MTAFRGSGATLSRQHRSPFARARGPLVPLSIAPRAPRIAPSGRPIGRPGNVGPEGHHLFVGRIFHARAKPGTGPVLRPSCHASQHTMPESGRAPGPPAGPGSFFGHCEKIWVFPSFGVPHPGIYLPRCLPPLSPLPLDNFWYGGQGSLFDSDLYVRL